MGSYTEKQFRRKILIRLAQVGAILIGAILYGTIGFYFIENAPLFESFYMAVITMTTVGYDEVIQLDDQGRLFAVTSIFVGLTASGVSLALITNLIFEEALFDIFKGRKLTKKLDKMQGHFIVCGCGTTGSSIVEELLAQNHEVVVIDLEPPEEIESSPLLLFVHGDARQDDVLTRAGISRALGLASTLTEDADNVFVTLTARNLNPQLRIVSRFKDPDTEKKLAIAGADEVVSPYRMGGKRLALALSDPAFHKILEATYNKKFSLSVHFAHLEVPEHAQLKQKKLRDADLRKYSLGALVVGIVEENGNAIFNPDPEIPLKNVAELLVLGDDEQIRALETHLKES